MPPRHAPRREKNLALPTFTMLRSLVARAAARVAPVVGSPRAAVRSISSTAARLEQAPDHEQGTCRESSRLTPAAASAYPFASHIVTRSHVAPKADSVRAPPPQVKHSSRGVMPRVDAQLTAELDPDEKIARLFSRRSPECIPPGSIVMVESYLSAGRSSTTTFAGVLIAVRRAGIATTFLLRTIAHKLGVEMRFHAYSPMIKDIKVIQRADAKKGQPGLLRTRRAKLYYMRRNEDRRVGSVGNVVKQYRAAEQKKADASNASSRRGPASRS